MKEPKLDAPFLIGQGGYPDPHRNEVFDVDEQLPRFNSHVEDQRYSQRGAPTITVRHKRNHLPGGFRQDPLPERFGRNANGVERLVRRF